MDNLVYSLCFTPSASNNSTLNFTCFDNKIHIRLRDYLRPEMIAGFEKKLTYLLTYLMNYSYLPTVLNKNESPEVLIKAFLQTEDIAAINRCIYANISNLNFIGIKLYKNYNKKDDLKPFGALRETLFPVNSNEHNIVNIGSLKFFLEALNIDLKNYLFNDAYSIILHKESGKEFDIKFKNKQIKKQKSSDNFEIVELW